MDLMAAIEAYRSSEEQVRARQARREARGRAIYDKLATAIGRGPQPVDGEVEAIHRFMREAAGWNLSVEDDIEDGHAIGSQHPGAAALLIVRKTLAEYSTPSEVELRYHGMRRASGHGAYGMNDGIVYVQATLHSVSGPRHHIDIPVVVRQGRVLAPSILMHNGTPRVITQNTLDDIVGMGEFTAQIPDRPHMYAPAPDKDAASAPRRHVPRLSPNMFKVLPTRNLIGSAVRGVYQTSTRVAMSPLWDQIEALANEYEELTGHDLTYDIREMGDHGHAAGEPEEQTLQDILQMLQEQVARAKSTPPPQPSGPKDWAGKTQHLEQMIQQQRGGRRGFYQPDVVKEVKPGMLGKDIPGADGSHVDVGERPTKGQLAPGQRVRMKQEAVARDRGGVKYKIAKGTRGTVIRDVDGADRVYYVRFEELGFAAPVPKEALSG